MASDETPIQRPEQRGTTPSGAGECRKFQLKPPPNWELYEQRKQEIARTARTHEEYELRVKELCEEMGI